MAIPSVHSYGSEVPRAAAPAARGRRRSRAVAVVGSGAATQEALVRGALPLAAFVASARISIGLAIEGVARVRA